MNFLRPFKNLWAVLSRGFGLLHANPRLLIPYVYLVFFHASWLTILFLIPRPPLLVILGPVIRAFVGEQALHYPYNLATLPHIYALSKYAVDMTCGIICAGIMISMISQAYQGVAAEWLLGLKRSLRRFFRLVVIWVLTFGLVVVAEKLLKHYIFPVMSHYVIYLLLEFLMTILMQSLLVFAIPVIIIENKKLLVALQRSLALFRHHAIETIIVVGVPCAFFIPLAFINTSYLMNRYFPEITLWVMSLRIFMYVCIDLAVTLGATIILMRHKEIEENSLS